MVLLYGPTGWRFHISEVTLHRTISCLLYMSQSGPLSERGAALEDVPQKVAVRGGPGTG